MAVEFGARILQEVERGRRPTRRRRSHHLDLVRPKAEFVAHRLLHFADAVGDEAEQAVRAADASHCLRNAVAEVAVAAGLADCAARDEEPRSDEKALLDRLQESRSAPPASRTVVKPRISMPREFLRLRRGQRLRVCSERRKKSGVVAVA